MVKSPFTIAGDIRHRGLIPRSGRSLGGGRGNPLQYSCLENSMERGPWWAPGLRRSQSPLDSGGHKESDTTEMTWHTRIYKIDN